MKLVVLDLDGTLLNNKGVISKLNKEVIKKIYSMGVKVVLATGRPYHGSINFYHELGLDTLFITDNGGSICHPNDTSFKKINEGLTIEVSHQLFKATKHMLESAFFSNNNIIYDYKYNKRLHDIFIGNGVVKHIECEFDKIDVAPTGIIYLVYKNMACEFENYLTSELSQDVHFRIWGSDSKHVIYEIYTAHTSKLSAIVEVCKYYNISTEEVIAFGDGINDVEMIGGVGLGVAMLNGEDVVKKVSKVISDFTNDEDGIAKALIKLFEL